MARPETSTRAFHVIDICPQCNLYDLDENLPGCPGRVKACNGPHTGGSQWPAAVRARRMARLARAGRITLIGGFAAE